MANAIAKRKLYTPPAEASKETKPKRKLVRVGKHYLDPEDVVGIKHAKDDLFIIKLRSEPDPSYPLWIRERQLGPLLKYFELVEVEDGE